MDRLLTNSEILKQFRKIDEMKTSGDFSGEDLNKRIITIHNKIVERLSFLVYNNVEIYKKFSNYEDLIQEGFIGLLRAVHKFDYNLFPNFFVYSERWIVHCIKRAASRFDIVYNPKKTRVIYGEPNMDEETEISPEEIYFIKEKKNEIKKVLESFSTRKREIVQRIFGLDSNDEQTLREIGHTYGLTHERVRQIKNEVILKLRKNKSINELY